MGPQRFADRAALVKARRFIRGELYYPDGNRRRLPGTDSVFDRTKPRMRELLAAARHRLIFGANG